MSDDAGIEARIQAVGRDILAYAHSAGPGLLRPQGWQQHLLEWAMQDAWLRVQLFRFVDVLPALRSGAAVAEHLQEYLQPDHRRLPAPLALALRFGAPTALAARRSVRRLARRFIAGKTAAEALAAVRRLRRRRMSFTLDLLGEATTSEAEADAYAQRYGELIDALCQAAPCWKPVPQIDDGPGGALPRVNVSLKLSSLDSQFDHIAPARTLETVLRRLRPILRRARERGAFVYVDMEQHAYKDLILAVFMTVLDEEEFRDATHVGIVLQAYLRETGGDLRVLLDWVRRRGCPITVRLVKGAYWDAETAQAAQRGWPCPVFTRKAETDAAFERLTAELLAHHDVVRPAIASHNVRSLAAAIVLAERHGLLPHEYELQMLLGMGDPLKVALVERGLHVRVYTPFGDLVPGMAYLIRRLLENTSNDSFLRQSFTERLPVDRLLADPGASSVSAGAPAAAQQRHEEMPMPTFVNEPLTDFLLPDARAAMQNAIHAVRAQCGRRYPLLIGGSAVEARDSLDSLDPAWPRCVVGRVACATAAHADEAVAAARHAWPSWRATPVSARITCLRRVAAGLRRRRFELAAWVLIETGKPWREADADVAEAIDYCEFYAAEMERLQRATRRRDVPGEDNLLVYEPRGVAAIIAPWNFPLAILTGMTVAALVTGNTVVVKPAEQSPVVAAKLFELFREAAVPPGVAHFLPGSGADVGARLVAHPAVDLIAFTGSRAVGLRIIENAARTQPAQQTVKRVIAEMGGKNAVIVDADADLDEAVRGVVRSAFGYAGQKCSACARAIVVAAAHDAFVRRVAEATRSLHVGPPEDPATFVGPLIDAAARDRVLARIEHGRSEAALVCAVEPRQPHGYFVGPTVFDDVPPHCTLAQEEIFGPVLAVIPAPDFEAALAIANDGPYGLTGGLYSRSPAHIERAKDALRVGNLYINRPITGALVDRQPFGGCKLSGTGGKAGGPDYLRQFCEPKTITENTIRHGLVPNLSGPAGRSATGTPLPGGAGHAPG